MLRQMLRVFRASGRKFLEALRESEKTRNWLTEVRKFTRVDESIEFKGLEPDLSLVTIGKGGCLERDIQIWLPNDDGARPQLTIGNRVFVGRNTAFGCYQPVRIGDDTLIGAYSYITSGNHRFEQRDVPIQSQGFSGAPIDIGSDVWIGAHVTILPGVSIGNSAIVGAGSVVTRSIPAHEVWAGVPAKFLKARP